MSNFQHFLITRINIDWHVSKPKTREERNNLDFLNHRLDIFEKICYPSVQAQINQNFIWLLLVDSALPDSIKKRLEKYRLEAKITFIFINIEDRETCLDTLKKVIQENFLVSSNYLITTNLDSDDAIAEDFIFTIQDQFQNQDFEFINFPFGYLYRFKDKTLYLREWLTAPCHTLIEKYKNFQTVLNYPHATITQYKVSQIFMKPMWLMTSHGKNVRTSYDVSAAWQPLSRLDNSFNIKLEISQQHILITYKEILSTILKVINSKKSWDTPKVKVRKIVGILSPSLILLVRKKLYNKNK